MRDTAVVHQVAVRETFKNIDVFVFLAMVLVHSSCPAEALKYETLLSDCDRRAENYDLFFNLSVFIAIDKDIATLFPLRGLVALMGS